MKKNILYPLIALAIIIIALIAGKKLGWIGGEFQLKVMVEQAEPRTLTELITANGKIKPEVEVKVSSDVSGEILELTVKEGDEVFNGQILAKIQPDIYQRHLEKMQASLRSAEANLAQAEAQLQQKELSFNRNKTLWEQQTISESEYELALSDYNIAKASAEASKAALRNAKASLNEAKDNLTKTTIYSPMDGTVSRLNVEKGERVVGTAQFEGTDMMTIANMNNMEVVVDVNENDIIRVSSRDTALIEVDAYLDRKFKGLVTEIANSAKSEGTSADQITNFEVKVLILPQSYRELIQEKGENFYPFRPGMSATVDIQTNTRADVLSVPIQSVTTRADTTTINTKDKDLNQEDDKTEVVFVVKEGRVEQRNVTPGIQDTRHIEIIEGLKEGEEVVTAPYSAIANKLKHNDPVEVVEKLFEDKEKK
ncbi:HlyD family secretion protein [Saccharicrinis carchari]|uniref:HlyD family secretion protein n=1 Tax=Saccharicrinis carchari TaxID=1168039 RepID=A0A521BVV6_SACCC|nr:efflux RND transporter periplasmic adaptor subunit [Saccharicrinis carchari]SMO51313.1 HlyD family secretion protein [Saccharicrinis carchari]